MRRIYKLLFVVLFTGAILSSCSDSDNVVNTPTGSISPLASTYNSDYAVDWTWLACRIVADESRDNPPHSARLYAYISVALYECVVQGMPLNRSMSGQLNEMPVMPSAYPGYEYDWPSVITGAMPIMFRGLFPPLYNSSNIKINDMATRQKQERYALKDSAVIGRSIQLGEAIARRILEWADDDGYHQIHGVPYTPPSILENASNWEPINPGDTAIEPYWGTLRTFAVENSRTNYLPPSYLFDTTVGSPFYNDELEIKQIRENPTPEQVEIAIFWRDKQLTFQPAGHWVSILNIIVKQQNMPLDKAAECYAFLGIGTADAFISCWYAKYFKNYLRPQSYIRRFMEPGWTPLIPTPPFPDYPSGHSTSSGTCAYLLTHLLGPVSFTDTTHLRIGMAPRHFTSFDHAANESSNSRVYGGIHYRNAIENGVRMGRNIGIDIVNRISLRRF